MKMEGSRTDSTRLDKGDLVRFRSWLWHRGIEWVDFLNFSSDTQVRWLKGWWMKSLENEKRLVDFKEILEELQKLGEESD